MEAAPAWATGHGDRMKEQAPKRCLEPEFDTAVDEPPPPSSDQVPDVRDARAPRPCPLQHTLCSEALRSRSRRIFTPRANGTLKVSQQVFDEWHRKGSKERKNLEQIFKACGYNPDRLL